MQHPIVWKFVPKMTTRHRQRTCERDSCTIASRRWLEQSQCFSLTGSLPLSGVIFAILCIAQSWLILLGLEQHDSGNTKNTTQWAVCSTSHLLFISSEGFHWCFRLSLASTATSMSHLCCSFGYRHKQIGQGCFYHLRFSHLVNFSQE